MNKRQKKKWRNRLGFKTWERYRYERLSISCPMVPSCLQSVASAKYLIEEYLMDERNEGVHSSPLVFRDVDDKGHIRPKM